MFHSFIFVFIITSNSVEKTLQRFLLPGIGTSCSSLAYPCSNCTVLPASTCFVVELWRITINVHHLQLSIQNNSILINSLPRIEA